MTTHHKIIISSINILNSYKSAAATIKIVKKIIYHVCNKNYPSDAINDDPANCYIALLMCWISFIFNEKVHMSDCV